MVELLIGCLNCVRPSCRRQQNLTRYMNVVAFMQNLPLVAHDFAPLATRDAVLVAIATAKKTKSKSNSQKTVLHSKTLGKNSQKLNARETQRLVALRTRNAAELAHVQIAIDAIDGSRHRCLEARVTRSLRLLRHLRTHQTLYRN